MSRFKKSHLASLCVLWLMLLCSQLACSPTQSDNSLQPRPTPTAAPKEPTELVFAGQVAAENGRWLNDCVVVLFKNGQEVTRTTSQLMESAFSRQGPMDGVFELRIPNAYKLSVAHEVYEQDDGRILMSLLPGVGDKRYLGTWFDDLKPSATRVLTLPDKQLEYTLAVLPLPTQTPQASVQLIVLPSRNDGQDWHLQLTGYYGTRWDVWQTYVAGRGSSMSWETFKYAVLVHNPHLETDKFVFYPEKMYLLPFNQ